MELHELEIGQARAGPRGGRQAVAGRFAGIGRRGKQPTDAPRGEHDRARLVRRSSLPPPTSRSPRRRARLRKSRSSRNVSVRRSIERASMTAAERARTISAPAASPPARTTRERECAPSRLNARRPKSSRSKRAPRRMSRAIAPGPSADQRRDDRRIREARPRRVACPGRAGSGSSSGPTAAATPPCASGLAPPTSVWVFVRSATRSGASASAATMPAAPGPDDDDIDGRRASHRLAHPDAPRPTSSMRSMARSRAPAISGSIVTSWVSVSRDRRTDRQRDLPHVGTEVAGTHEPDAGHLGGDVVAHRALGDQGRAGRRVLAQPSDHPRGGPDVVGLGQNLRACTRGARGRRRRERGIAARGCPSAVKRSCTSHVPLPRDDLDAGLRADVAGEVAVGDEEHAIGSRASGRLRPRWRTCSRWCSRPSPRRVVLT